jgi:predicted CopG family antitoxin
MNNVGESFSDVVMRLANKKKSQYLNLRELGMVMMQTKF